MEKQIWNTEMLLMMWWVLAVGSVRGIGGWDLTLRVLCINNFFWYVYLKSTKTDWPRLYNKRKHLRAIKKQHTCWSWDFPRTKDDWAKALKLLGSGCFPPALRKHRRGIARPGLSPFSWVSEPSNGCSIAGSFEKVTKVLFLVVLNTPPPGIYCLMEDCRSA